MNRSFVRRQLKNFWWAYLAVVIFAAAVWNYAFDWALEPPAEKQLYVAVIGAGADGEAMEQDLRAALEAEGYELEVCTVQPMSYIDPSSLVAAVFARSVDADLVLLPEGSCFDEIGESYFMPLPSSLASGDVYTENGVPYARCYDGGPGSRLAAYGYYSEEGAAGRLFVTTVGADKELALAAAAWLLD